MVVGCGAFLSGFGHPRVFWSSFFSFIAYKVNWCVGGCGWIGDGMDWIGFCEACVQRRNRKKRKGNKIRTCLVVSRALDINLMFHFLKLRTRQRLSSCKSFQLWVSTAFRGPLSSAHPLASGQIHICIWSDQKLLELELKSKSCGR